MASDEHLRDASYRATDFDLKAAADPPARARAVVVGGGIMGVSVALHLARLGWTDTVVLERSRIASGTTWHAAGLMTRVRGTHMQTELASYSRDFYRDLAALSGIDAGYYPNGSLSVARTTERLTELRYALTLAHHHGLPARELAREEIAAVSPLLAADDLSGGVLFEEDATVNPGWAAFATAKAAHDLGVRFAEGVRVTGFLLDRSAAGPARIKGVRTERGDLECDIVVLAAGLWTRDLALLAGARVPLHPAEHYWAQTEPVDGATRDLPIIRDLDGSIYVRHYRGGLVVGAFEPDGRPRTAASIPEDFSFGEFAPDLEHFARPLARAAERMPALERARFAHYLCAPESFTPDGNFVLGETGEVTGLFIAAGMNSQGIILGPGAGRALAAWIDEGAPTVDAADVDVRRFAPAQNSAGYLFERTRESLGRLYAMHWPFQQPGTARDLRQVPLFGRLAAAGAVFGEAAGWERADWYAPPGERPEYEYSYGRQNWFAAVAEEHRAAREGVALFDLSSFTKLRVEGPDALATVQRVFTANLDRAPGRVMYTSLLNTGGGVELDATVTRLGERAFQVVTSATAQARAYHWLRRHADPGAVVTDVTSGFGVLSVTGPRSRELLASLTDADLSDGAFPFARAREIDVGWTPALALRMSFTGELGWELYAPVESLPALYERLVEAGRPLGLRHAGYRALDGLRAEKGYIHWGHDAGPSDTPYEAGLATTLAMDKPGGFVGQEALVAAGLPRRRLVSILLADPEPQLYQGESVLRRGRVVGRVTSGAYGHTLGAAVGLAALECGTAEVDEILAAGDVEVEIAGRVWPARVAARPFYDPDARRLRGG